MRDVQVTAAIVADGRKYFAATLVRGRVAQEWPGALEEAYRAVLHLAGQLRELGLRPVVGQEIKVWSEEVPE